MYTAPIESNILFECQFNQHESTNWGHFFFFLLLFNYFMSSARFAILQILGTN